MSPVRSRRSAPLADSQLAQHPPAVPLVIRLSGTEADAGRKLLIGAPLESRETMDDAAKEAVRLAAGGTAHFNS